MLVFVELVAADGTEGVDDGCDLVRIQQDLFVRSCLQQDLYIPSLSRTSPPQDRDSPYHSTAPGSPPWPIRQ